MATPFLFLAARILFEATEGKARNYETADSPRDDYVMAKPAGRPERALPIAGYILWALVRQPAACRVGAGGIDRYIAFFNAGYLAVLIHHERRAVSNAKRRDQNPVRLRDLAHVIAEYRVGDVEFLFPVRQGWREIGTDRQNLRFICIKFCDTRLVRV